MKHFSKTLENHLPKRKRFFPSCHPYQQADTNVELKGWQFFRSYWRNETHNHIWTHYFHSNTQCLSANGTEFLPLTLALWFSLFVWHLHNLTASWQNQGHCQFEIHILWL